MIRPVELEPLEDYCLRIKYSDGVECIVDLSGYAGKGVFSLWNNYDEFRKVHIGPGGQVSWSVQIDLCPDALYLRVTGHKPEDIFPALRELMHHAGD